MRASSARDLSELVEKRSERLIEIARDLIKIPSENRAPKGSEAGCQLYAADLLRRAGWNPTLYQLSSVPELPAHSLYWPGREYADRPNLAAVRTGSGEGKSLILSGHVDTVPAGSACWKHPPFGGLVDGNRLYGRGSNDMKSGIATNLFIAETLTEAGIQLQGNLTVESVVDEEFGGVNGTLAGRLAGYNTDAAIISEPSGLRICPAQRGGRTVDITLRAPNQGILSGAVKAGVIEQLSAILTELPKFQQHRDGAAPRHPLYAHLGDPVPARVTRIETAPWGTSEPTNTPDRCRLQLFWQAMPGEQVADMDRAFSDWLDGVVHDYRHVFVEAPEVAHPIRWLPGSALAPNDPMVAAFQDTAGQVLGRAPEVNGIEGPCDMFVFHQFGIPALLWGVRGGNTHMPDEYVELDSLVDAAKVLLHFVCDWCGVAS